MITKNGLEESKILQFVVNVVKKATNAEGPMLDSSKSIFSRFFTINRDCNYLEQLLLN